ncbi:MAG: hypothetical protein FWH18_03080 [Marinilabiliaceae bacterium]|nr:hypothetical protein [Marinilabiliaceae bacterium]
MIASFFGRYPELRLRLFGVIYVALVPSAAVWGVWMLWGLVHSVRNASLGRKIA